MKCYNMSGFLCQRWGLLEDDLLLEELGWDELEPLVLPPCVCVPVLDGIVLLPP